MLSHPLNHTLIPQNYLISEGKGGKSNRSN